MAVEYRSGASESYGKGKKKTMKFKQFVKRFAEGDPHLYLTTQELGLDLEGRPLLMAPPVTQLSGSLSLLSLTHTHIPRGAARDSAVQVIICLSLCLSLSRTHTPYGAARDSAVQVSLSLSLSHSPSLSLPYTRYGAGRDSAVQVIK